MRAIRALLCMAVCAGISCAEPGDPAQTGTTITLSAPGSHDDAVHEKPRAPIEVDLSARRLRGSEYRLSLKGTPETDVEQVLLEVLLPENVTLSQGNARARFGTTAAGTTRALTATVRVDGPGAEVEASARVRIIDGLEPNRMAAVVLGTPPPAKPVPVRTITLPSGERIDEVGP